METLATWLMGVGGAVIIHQNAVEQLGVGASGAHGSQLFFIDSNGFVHFSSMVSTTSLVIEKRLLCNQVGFITYIVYNLPHSGKSF